MKQFMVSSLLVFLFMIGFVVRSQTPETPPEWPPDPARIFADGVQWMLPEEPEASLYPVQIDFDQHVIRVYSAEEDQWETYPFPDTEYYVERAFLQSDGKIRVILWGREFSYWSETGPQDVVILNPETGQYENPPTVCEGKVLQAQPDEPGKWVAAYYDNAGEERFLCHSKTGEIRDVLPNGLTEWRVFPSLDGLHLVLIGLDWKQRREFQIYAYNIGNDQRISLGSVDYYDNTVSVCDWVSDTRGLLCNSDNYRSWPGTAFYAFDVTQTSSLENAFHGWYEDYFHIDEPRRYISLYSPGYASSFTGSAGPDTPCTITIYDADQLTHQAVGYECLSIALTTLEFAPYFRQGETIYFLTADSEEATVSTLQSYNTGTLQLNNMLWSGEIESVVSVSPDGRYIVLLIDDNGELNFPRTLCCPQHGGLQVVILDNESSNIIYHSEPIGVYTSEQVVWLDSHAIVMGASREYHPLRDAPNAVIVAPSSLRRITLNDDSSIDVSITTRQDIVVPKDEVVLDPSDFETLSSSPNKHYWMRKDNIVIDLWTFQPVPILRDGITEEYAISMNWLIDSTLEVRVSMPDDYTQTAVYEVILPEK